MTDNEIVKALECCSSGSYGCENGCPLDKECDSPIKASEKIMSNALDLINRLQAENEKLKKAKYIFSTVDYCADDLQKALEENERLKKGWRADVILTANAKAEAYKEFAERLKENLMFLPLSAVSERFVAESVLDNLLKEMECTSNE